MDTKEGKKGLWVRAGREGFTERVTCAKKKINWRKMKITKRNIPLIDREVKELISRI